jgi:hypothetical protein
MRSHLVGFGMPGQTQSAMQSDTPNTAADHMIPSFAFTMMLAKVIETHAHKGDFKGPWAAP